MKNTPTSYPSSSNFETLGQNTNIPQQALPVKKPQPPKPAENVFFKAPPTISEEPNQPPNPYLQTQVPDELKTI